MSHRLISPWLRVPQLLKGVYLAFRSGPKTEKRYSIPFETVYRLSLRRPG